MLEREESVVEIVGRYPVVSFTWSSAPGWPVKVVSSDVSRFGYNQQDFPGNP